MIKKRIKRWFLKIYKQKQNIIKNRQSVRIASFSILSTINLLANEHSMLLIVHCLLLKLINWLRTLTRRPKGYFRDGQGIF